MSQSEDDRNEWIKDLAERQHNLTPAEPTRSSRYRASGLPPSAPLPIAVVRRKAFLGVGLFVISIVGAAMFSTRWTLAAACAVATTGLFLLVTSIRWKA